MTVSGPRGSEIGAVAEPHPCSARTAAIERAFIEMEFTVAFQRGAWRCIWIIFHVLLFCFFLLFDSSVAAGNPQPYQGSSAASLLAHTNTLAHLHMLDIHNEFIYITYILWLSNPQARFDRSFWHRPAFSSKGWAWKSLSVPSRDLHGFAWDCGPSSVTLPAVQGWPSANEGPYCQGRESRSSFGTRILRR